MASNLYSDYDENTGESEPRPDRNTEDSDEPTTLIPKSILAGKHCEVGDKVVLRIVAMHEDEVEVACATDKKDQGEEEDGDTGEEEPASTDNGNSNYY